MMRLAEIIRSGAIQKAIREINPEVCRKRQSAIRHETGESAPQILERLSGESIAENCRQSGLCPATVRRYRERWGIDGALTNKSEVAK